jgi:hypothetical protein
MQEIGTNKRAAAAQISNYYLSQNIKYIIDRDSNLDTWWMRKRVEGERD